MLSFFCFQRPAARSLSTNNHRGRLLAFYLKDFLRFLHDVSYFRISFKFFILLYFLFFKQFIRFKNVGLWNTFTEFFKVMTWHWSICFKYSFFSNFFFLYKKGKYFLVKGYYFHGLCRNICENLFLGSFPGFGFKLENVFIEVFSPHSVEA